MLSNNVYGQQERSIATVGQRQEQSIVGNATLGVDGDASCIISHAYLHSRSKFASFPVQGLDRPFARKT